MVGVSVDGVVTESVAIDPIEIRLIGIEAEEVLEDLTIGEECEIGSKTSVDGRKNFVGDESLGDGGWVEVVAGKDVVGRVFRISFEGENGAVDVKRGLIEYAVSELVDTCSWFQGHGLKNTRAITGGIDAWSQQIDSSLRRYRLEID